MKRRKKWRMQLPKRRIISGNHAVAEAAIRVGCRFFAGYPITPSSEIAERMSELLPKYGGRFIQMEDELASMGAIVGASLTGTKSLTATSGPGFSLKQENLGFAIMAEVPCVIAEVQRGGPSTGMPTYPGQQDLMQARWGRHGDQEIIVLFPDSIQESYELTIRSFNLSEKYRTPVVLMFDEVISHMSEAMNIPDEVEIINRAEPDVPPEEYYPFDGSKGLVPPLATYGTGYRYHITGLAHDKTGFPTNDPKVVDEQLSRKLEKIRKNRDDIVEVEEFQLDDAEYAIFALGSVGRAAKQTAIELHEEGVKIGVFRPKTLWPFADKEVIELAKNVEKIFVVELNYGQIISEVERFASKYTDVLWFGRADGRLIPPREIKSFIKENI
jgi:2-oxoglutarate ferredoxin oxidoreductase subunit alpha